jgi:hypothetical protein
VGIVNLVFAADTSVRKTSSTFVSAKIGYIPDKSHANTTLNNTSLFLCLIIAFPYYFSDLLCENLLKTRRKILPLHEIFYNNMVLQRHFATVRHLFSARDRMNEQKRTLGSPVSRDPVAMEMQTGCKRILCHIPFMTFHDLL